MTLLNFFRCLRLASIFWPYTGTKRDQIQSFAVINRLAQINSDNLEQYADKRGSELFFSRKWSELKFNPSEFICEPSYLLAFEPENNTTIQNPFVRARSKSTYRLFLYVLDKFVPMDHEKVNSTFDDFRTIEEIYIEAETKLKVLFDFLSTELVWCSVEGEPYNFYPKGHLDKLVTESLITDYLVDEKKTHSFREMLYSENAEIIVNRISIPIPSLHGIQCTVNLRLNCWDAATFNYDNPPLESVVTIDGRPILIDFSDDEMTTFDPFVMGSIESQPVDTGVIPDHNESKY